MAHELLAQGRAQTAANDLEGALVSFSNANAIMHVPTTLFALASAQAALGQLVAARATLQELAAIPPNASRPEAFKRARAAGSELQADVERRLPTAELTALGLSPTDRWQVLVDGVPTAEGATSLRLDPGSHVLAATAPGKAWHDTVSLMEGETRLLTLDFRRARAEAKSKPATTTPRDTKAPRVEVYVLGGLGLVGLGTGFVLGAAADHTRTTLERSCAPTCTATDASTVRHRATAANVAFGVGAAAIAAAAVTYVVELTVARRPEASAERSRRVSLQFLPSAHGAALSAFGSF